ncbi:MAG: alpha/beta hydrolase family protein, partial [Terriglobales bacterium]
MRRRYQNWMHEWETRLTTRDTNRIVRPFEWGEEWTHDWPGLSADRPAAASNTERFFHDLNHHIIAHSDEFFSYRTPTDFRIEKHPVRLHASGGNNGDDRERGSGNFLRFTSAAETPYRENNTANARWFPARGRRAVIVLPQWNADALGHNALCRMLNFCGIAGLRLSMPYHDVRRP